MSQKQAERLIKLLESGVTDNTSSAYAIALDSSANDEIIDIIIRQIDTPSISLDRIKFFLDILVNLDTEIASKIISERLVTQQSLEARRHMIWLLEHCSSQSALPALAEIATNDPDISLRIMAIRGLSHIGSVDALPILNQLSENATFSTDYRITIGEAATEAQHSVISKQ